MTHTDGPTYFDVAEAQLEAKDRKIASLETELKAERARVDELRLQVHRLRWDLREARRCRHV